MKSFINVIDTLCYGAFYARKTNSYNATDNHDLDTLIETEAIFIATGTTLIASIMFTGAYIMPYIIQFAPLLSIAMISLTVVIPMLLFRESRFMKVIKHYESLGENKQKAAKRVWRTFCWSTWIMVAILLTIATWLKFI